jgi:nitrite reductase (NO-forming)
MQQDSILRQVITFSWVTALSLALCTTFAHVEDAAPAGQTSGSPAASQAGNPPIIELPQDIARLPMPSMAPPVNRKNPATVHVELEARPKTALIADGVAYKFWTYNGTVPGPMVRAPG